MGRPYCSLPFPMGRGRTGWSGLDGCLQVGAPWRPHIGTTWLSYVLPFSCFSVLPILLLVKEEYKRRSVDDEEKEEEESTGEGEGEGEVRGSREQLIT